MKRCLILMELLVIVLIMGCSSNQLNESDNLIDNNLKENTNQKVINPVQIHKESDNIMIGFKYGEAHKFFICFEPNEVNHIMGISRFYMIPNEININKLSNMEDYAIYIAATDWIGPYTVRKAAINKSSEARFTGGWHGNQADGTGDPTARMIDYHIQQKPSNVKLIVKNNIQGYNTTINKEEILQEIVTYDIKANKIEISVEIEALEDLIMEKYYGLQTQNTIYNGELIYNGIGEKLNPYETSQSLPYSSSMKSSLSLRSKEDDHMLQVILDNSYGLGKAEYVSKDKPYAFTLEYGKSYFNLVNGIELNMKKGEKVSWKGTYVFTRK